jgi:hypothetical protein
MAGRTRVWSQSTLLFNAALYQVISFTGGPHFPGPWASSEAIAPYFQEHPNAVMVCAFLQFGAAIPLGIFVGNDRESASFSRSARSRSVHCVVRRADDSL